MASLVTDPARAPGAAVLTHLTRDRPESHLALGPALPQGVGDGVDRPLPGAASRAPIAGFMPGAPAGAWPRPSTPLDALLGDLARR